MLLPLSSALLGASSPARAADPAAPLELPPSHGVLMSVDAQGKLFAGNVVVDTAKLGALGVTLFSGDRQVVQKTAPLADGLRVVGLPKGDRVVEGAIDSLMYFDANGDTYLDALDPAFAALSLFSDANGDHRIGPGEVRSFDALGIDSISRFGSIRMKEGR